MQNKINFHRHLFCLSVDNICEQFELILKSQPTFPEPHKNKNMDDFVEYFVDNYFEGAFPIGLWSHYETFGPRTNNNLEGYNNKLKIHVSRAHPNIYKQLKYSRSKKVVRL